MLRNTAAILSLCLLFPFRAYPLNDSTEKPELTLERNQAIVAVGGRVVLRVPLRPRRAVRTQPADWDEYIEDNAHLVGSCLVVRRGYHSLGSFCHVPSIRSVEVYTLAGRRRTYRDPDLLPYFNGTPVTSPSGQWGLLLFGEGTLLVGYLVVKADGSVGRPTQLGDEIEFCDGGYQWTGDSVTLSEAKIGGKPLALIIKSDGRYTTR